MVKRLVPYGPFNTDLSAAVDLDEQLEVIGRHLTKIELRFTQHWDDNCDRPANEGDDWRSITASLRSGVLVTIYAREMPGRPDSIQLRKVAVIRPPTG